MSHRQEDSASTFVRQTIMHQASLEKRVDSAPRAAPKNYCFMGEEFLSRASPEQVDDAPGAIQPSVPQCQQRIMTPSHDWMEMLTRNQVQSKHRVDALNRLREVSDFKKGKRHDFLPYLPLTVDTSTGSCGFCAVSAVDRRGCISEDVVVSVPYMVRFYRDDTPGCRMSETDTTDFFLNSDNFPESPAVPYPDFIKLILQTPFATLPIGPEGNERERQNRHRFRVTPLSDFKKLLRDIDTFFPERARARPIRERACPISYGSEGNKFAYTSRSRNDHSTGFLPAIGTSISPEDKSKIPAMCRPYVVENFTPACAKLFGIPPELVGKCHVVACSVVTDGVSVKTHREAIRELVRTKRVKRYKQKAAGKAKRDARQSSKRKR
ncbi:unnamed protein product [Ectocarpus sp. 6 AP-2014]